MDANLGLLHSQRNKTAKVSIFAHIEREHAFSSQTNITLKLAYLEKLHSRFQPNYAQQLSPLRALCGRSNTRISHPRWRAAAILENQKFAISRQRFDRLSRNLARRHVWTLNRVGRNGKNLNF